MGFVRQGVVALCREGWHQICLGVVQCSGKRTTEIEHLEQIQVCVEQRTLESSVISMFVMISTLVREKRSNWKDIYGGEERANIRSLIVGSAHMAIGMVGNRIHACVTLRYQIQIQRLCDLTKSHQV